MFSSTRKCWPSDFFGPDGSRAARPNAAVAFASIRCSSSSGVLAARLGESGERVDDVGRLVRACRGRGWGERYGLSVSARIRSAGTCGGGLAELRRLRVGHVAGERDVVAALERERQQRRRREAVEDHRRREAARGRRRCRRRRRACGSRPAGRSVAASSSCRSKSRRCASRGASRGSSRARSRRPRRPSGGRAARPARRCRRASALPAWCGSIPSAAKTPSSASAIASAVRHDCDSGADRDDARDADRAGALDESRGRVVAPVEVRVRVDHPPAARFHAGELVGDHLLGIELLEERSRLAERLAGRERARLPAADPARRSRR